MDPLLSTLDQFPILKHTWRHTDCGMDPLPIVKLFDFLEKFSFSMRFVVKINIRQPFSLRRSEKRFGDRVVPAISFSAHALNKPVFRDYFSEPFAAKLHTSIGVDHQACRRSASPYCAIQSIQNPFVAQRRAYGPSYYHAGKKVDKDRRIQPATTARQIGYIRHPNLIRRPHCRCNTV